MSEKTKVRHYVRPSSLASYFGIGWNSFEEQLDIDRGLAYEEFDEASQDRMNLGTFLENSVLDYFENKLDIEIINRNSELIEFYGGKILGKIDGMTWYNSKKTLVECKVSNAKSYKFTEHKPYHIQIQAYMIDNDYDQAILCGLWNGKPIYKIIERDDELIEDIKNMTDFVVDILLGLADIDDIPDDLKEKYLSELSPMENVTSREMEYFRKYGRINENKLKYEKELRELKREYEDVTFEEGTFEDDFTKVKIKNVVRKGGLDADTLFLDHPEIDPDRYRGEDSVYQRFTIKMK